MTPSEKRRAMLALAQERRKHEADGHMICSRCEKDKPVTEFHMDKNRLGCTNKYHAKGFCQYHYDKNKRSK